MNDIPTNERFVSNKRKSDEHPEFGRPKKLNEKDTDTMLNIIKEKHGEITYKELTIEMRKNGVDSCKQTVINYCKRSDVKLVSA